MNSYEVRFWDIKKVRDTASGRWRVRWAVAARAHCKSFPARPLADGFLVGLKDAVRDHQPFDPATGLPVTPQQQAVAGDVSWYEHARAYTDAKWAHLAPISRRSVAESLTTVTIALVRDRRGAPDPAVLRRSLFGWAFNPGTRNLTPPTETAAALAWMTAASLPIAALEETATTRLALDACARTLAGKSAAASTQRRKRAVFHNAVRYAVELRLLDANPTDRIQWKAPAVAQTVDRRVVAGPGQISGLLTAVYGLSDRGQHLEAFYACLYYAYLRPSEAVMLKEADCRLPSRGWGRIDLAASAPRAGKDWTDDGTARQARGLKHRAQHETRSIPIPTVQ